MCIDVEQDKQNYVRFEAKKMLIGDFLQTTLEKPYIIPPFQRPYCWTSDQVEQLVRDLLEFYDLQKRYQGAHEYSLGTVVCELKDSCFSILDGQQRLTTLDLFLNYISKQLNIETGKRGRIIACYQYLSGCEGKLEGALPSYEMQETALEDILKKYVNEKGIRESEIPWAEIEGCIRQKVYVIRVTLPLVNGNQGEAAKMFEIINVSGQRLSLLDQIKARLLSFIPEEQKDERALVSGFWDALPELLCQPKRAAKGFDFVQKKKKGVDCAEFLKEEMLSEIIEDSLRENVVGEVLESEKNLYKKKKDEEKKRKREKKSGTEKEEDSKKNLSAEPPIDVSDLLVIANELLRNSLEDSSLPEEKDPNEVFVLKLSNKHFDWLTKETTSGSSLMSPTEKILRLIGTTNLLLQIVGHWGVYRQRGKNASEVSTVEELTSMRALQLSFMAENRFHSDAQYWFLMLAANVLCGPSSGELPLGERSIEVASFRRNWTFTSDKLEKLHSSAFKRLTGWGVHRACTSETGTDAALRWALLNDSEFQRTFKEEVQSLSAAVKEWKYDDGLRHWQLYLLDWLLWNDRDNTELKTVIDNFQTSNERIARGLEKFKWSNFSNIRQNFRIVRHGAIEHWFAREMANDDAQLLEKLNGFGNLALIDTSLNSTLRNLAVGGKGGKSKKVLSNNANHSLKLGWLAVFTDTCPSYGWNDVEALTDFWGAYMSGYPYEELVKNP